MLNEALKDYSDVTIGEDVLYTEYYLETYKEILESDRTATSQEDVDQIFGRIDGAYQELKKNIDLWKKWQNKTS